MKLLPGHIPARSPWQVACQSDPTPHKRFFAWELQFPPACPQPIPPLHSRQSDSILPRFWRQSVALKQGPFSLPDYHHFQIVALFVQTEGWKNY